VTLFGAILRLRDILTSFEEFAGQEILTERDLQDYQSADVNLYAELRAPPRRTRCSSTTISSSRSSWSSRSKSMSTTC
jgi:hypothetical protein